MNIHEYQAKGLLREFGVPVPNGFPVLSAEDAEDAAKRLRGPVWVVKSQIHAGGRGKGTFKEPEAGEKGGVRLAKSAEEAKAFVQQMLGRTLVTAQTGPAGVVTVRFLIEEANDGGHQAAQAAMVDRSGAVVADREDRKSVV